MDGWEIALWIGAGFVAMLSLVRLMITRRDQWIDGFSEDIRQARQRRKPVQPETEEHKRSA